MTAGIEIKDKCLQSGITNSQICERFLCCLQDPLEAVGDAVFEVHLNLSASSCFWRVKSVLDAADDTHFRCQSFILGAFDASLNLFEIRNFEARLGKMSSVTSNISTTNHAQ